jgi:hypothetical protein
MSLDPTVGAASVSSNYTLAREVGLRPQPRLELSVSEVGAHVTVATVLEHLGEVEHHLARVESRLHGAEIRDVAARDARAREAYVRATAALARTSEALRSGEPASVVGAFAELSKTIAPLAAHPDAAPLAGDLLEAGRSVLGLAARALRGSGG